MREDIGVNTPFGEGVIVATDADGLQPIVYNADSDVFLVTELNGAVVIVRGFGTTLDFESM